MHAGANLVNWSIGNHKPMPSNTPVRHLRKDYFVYYSHGTKPKEPYMFWIDVQVRFILLLYVAFKYK